MVKIMFLLFASLYLDFSFISVFFYGILNFLGKISPNKVKIFLDPFVTYIPFGSFTLPCKWVHLNGKTLLQEFIYQKVHRPDKTELWVKRLAMRTYIRTYINFGFFTKYFNHDFIFFSCGKFEQNGRSGQDCVFHRLSHHCLGIVCNWRAHRCLVWLQNQRNWNSLFWTYGHK